MHPIVKLHPTILLHSKHAISQLGLKYPLLHSTQPYGCGSKQFGFSLFSVQRKLLHGVKPGTWHDTLGCNVGNDVKFDLSKQPSSKLFNLSSILLYNDIKISILSVNTSNTSLQSINIIKYY